MTRTLKPETQIKNRLNQFLAEHGTTTSDTSMMTGERFFVAAPNKNFHTQGYMRYVASDGTIWTADLKKGDPSQITCVKQVRFFSGDEERAKQQHLAHLRTLLSNNFRTMSLDEITAVNTAIALVFDRLVELGVEVE